MSTEEQTQVEPLERGRILMVTVVAVIAGLVTAIVVVLPAEYGYDPSGMGEKLGLTQLANPAPLVTEVPDAPDSDAGEISRGRETITLAAGEGVELKLTMLAGQKVTYRWDASATVHVDLHGEPQGDTSGYYESYVVSEATRMEGQFTAVFDGTHGWYWRNDTGAPVSIDVTYAGQFQGRVPRP